MHKIAVPFLFFSILSPCFGQIAKGSKVSLTEASPLRRDNKEVALLDAGQIVEVITVNISKLEVRWLRHTGWIDKKNAVTLDAALTHWKAVANQGSVSASEKALAHAALALAHLERGDEETAAAALKSSGVSPEARTAFYLMVEGQIQLASGDAPEAVTLLRSAKDKNPSDPAIHLNLGAAHFANGAFSDAKEAFSAALLSGDWALALSNRSAAKLAEAAVDDAGVPAEAAVKDARNDVERALVLQPELAAAIHNRGDIIYASGGSDAIQRAYDDYHKSAISGLTMGYLNRAWLLAITKNNDINEGEALTEDQKKQEMEALTKAVHPSLVYYQKRANAAQTRKGGDEDKAKELFDELSESTAKNVPEWVKKKTNAIGQPVADSGTDSDGT